MIVESLRFITAHLILLTPPSTSPPKKLIDNDKWPSFLSLTLLLPLLPLIFHKFPGVARLDVDMPGGLAGIPTLLKHEVEKLLPLIWGGLSIRPLLSRLPQLLA